MKRINDITPEQWDALTVMLVRELRKQVQERDNEATKPERDNESEEQVLERSGN